MADHRAEQILTAMEARVTGLPTTGANVHRAMLYDLEETETSALDVRMGPNTPVDEGNMGFQDSTLEVVINAHVKAAGVQVDSVLNEIAKEVYTAIMSERTFDLFFVRRVLWQGESEPELSGDANRPTARREMRFAIDYRHSNNDPSQ